MNLWGEKDGAIVWKKRAGQSERKKHQWGGKKKKKKKKGEKTLAQLKSSKVCTLTTRGVVISPFVRMEHLISPKRWIPFQGRVRFQLNMAESRKHGRFFCNPLSQQAAPASLWELSQRAALLFFRTFLCPLNISKKGLLEVHNCNSCLYTKRGRGRCTVCGRESFYCTFCRKRSAGCSKTLIGLLTAL